MKQPLRDFLQEERVVLGNTNEDGDHFGECGDDPRVLVLPVAHAVQGQRTDLPLRQQALLGYLRLFCKAQDAQSLLFLPNSSQTT